jgi:carbon-monoxide dehydrogenase large subunit
MARKYIGERIKRREDARLITGQGQYIDDLKIAGLLHMKLVRSPHAHARIVSIDTERAAALPGVVDVYTAADLTGKAPFLPIAPLVPGCKVPERGVLATDRVRLVGDPVAAVVARDWNTASDAVELVDVEYEALPAVVDPETAMEPGASLLFPEYGENVAFRMPLGDVSEAMAAADTVVRLRLDDHRIIPNAMETRGIIASYRRADECLTVHLTTQAPHLMKTELSTLLGIPEVSVRVIAPDMGGAFGSKMNVYPEEMLAVVLSRQLGKPVKWIEERREAMLATSHGRGVLAFMEAGFKKDGSIVALSGRFIGDLGAYLHESTAIGPVLTALNMTGCYHVPAVGGEVIGVFTNKTPLDPFRGYYRAEAIYFIERVMNEAARQLGIDPVEIRRKNFVQPSQFPYTNPLGMSFDSGDYDLTLDRALARFDYAAFRREQAAAREHGRYIGVGFSTFAWRATQSGTFIPPDCFFIPGGWESASIRVERNGAITLRTGISPHGQGTGTALAQIAAEGLDVPVESIRVVYGDTETSPYGLGTMGSRSLAAGGSAVYYAVQKIREKATALAAHLLEAQPADIAWENGKIGVQGKVEGGMTLQEIAEVSQHGRQRPEGMEPGLEASGYHDPADYNAPFACHVCTVEVDPDTGDVKVQRYIVAEDSGLIVNPLLADGQTHGGVAQGLGQALIEAAVYEPDSGQPLTSSFMSYAMPTSHTMPMIEIERTDTRSPLNPLGAKGLAEAGNIGAPPAVVNAVLDALAPLGVTDIDMPLWPERVWRAIKAAKEASDASR